MTIRTLKTVLLLLLLAVSAEGKSWRGIVPLHSTRQDVERILGPSKDACNCIYKTPREVVTIDYARDTCTTNPHGWNVPRDTVVTINVSMATPTKLSDLKIDTRNYKQARDLHTPATYYSNEEEGIMYQVSEDGTVALAIYGPSSDDFKLKCDPNKLRSQPQAPFDEYGPITFNSEKARLENYAAQLNFLSESVGYIVVYPASKKSLAKSLRRARRARSYLVRVTGVKANRIAVIAGGCRDTFRIELYILPRTVPPPRPQPQLCQMQHRDSIGYIIVYAGRRACVDEAKDQTRRTKRYVVDNSGIQASRIKWIDGGYRDEPTVILQPAPGGAPETYCSPLSSRAKYRSLHCAALGRSVLSLGFGFNRSSPRPSFV